MIGSQDIWVALALGVFFFGAKKLPELSRSVGQALSEFKRGVAGSEAESLTPTASAPKADGTAAPPKPEETPPRQI
jgi:TatA/E family protein of Tat protein translocase